LAVSSQTHAQLIEELIGSTLASIVKTQGMVASQIAEIVETLGFEPAQANQPLRTRTFSFEFERSEIVEGVTVGRGSVISMGVYIGQSTRIYNRETGETGYGRVPPGSVVVSGSLPSADGKYSLYCAVIVKTVDAKTRAKTGINELLRKAG